MIKAGEFELDTRHRILCGPFGDTQLSPKQAALVELFMRYSGRPVSRRTIMSEVWETSYLGDTRTLEVHVCRLRKTIEPDPNSPRYLCTMRGVGYVFYASV